MNIEETKEAIKIMQAYADGKTIEIERTIDEWVEVFCPQFDWVHCKYRIKPESEYRPFESAEEVMEAIKEHGDWLVWKQNDVIYHMAVIGKTYIILYNNVSYSFEEVMKEYTFTDGTPFGKLVQ